jgi:hypothetical protein
MKVADRREQALLLEEQDLRQELAMCKSNLEKAEDEVPFTSFALLSLLSEQNQKTALNVYLKPTWKLVKKQFYIQQFGFVHIPSKSLTKNTIN